MFLGHKPCVVGCGRQAGSMTTEAERAPNGALSAPTSDNTLAAMKTICMAILSRPCAIAGWAHKNYHQVTSTNKVDTKRSLKKLTIFSKCRES